MATNGGPVAGERFRRLACQVSDALGSHWAFLAAVGVVCVWAMSGPLFHFNDHWQLIINTGTTVVTFLMVFVIQTSQNRDSRAVHLKLDELIRAQVKARNVFADLEDASEDELLRFKDEFRKLREREGMSHLEAADMASVSMRKRRRRGQHPGEHG